MLCKNNNVIVIKIIIKKSMFQFLIGLGVGIYIGTNYNFKPTINFITKVVERNFPEEAIPKKNK